jgi:hypothetical protein
MNFTPLSTSILSELVLFLRFFFFFFSLSSFWDSNREQGCWHFPDNLHLNLHAWAVRKVVKCCEGESWEVFWVVTHGIQSTTHLLTGGAEKVLRIFDLNCPDAPPTLLEGSPGTPIRAAVWHHSDQTILSSSNDIGGVRCGHWSIQFCFHSNRVPYAAGLHLGVQIVRFICPMRLTNFCSWVQSFLTLRKFNFLWHSAKFISSKLCMANGEGALL